jgi:hypothetical protein
MKRRGAVLFSILLLVLAIAVPAHVFKEAFISVPTEQPRQASTQPPGPLTPEEVALRKKFAILTEDEFMRQVIAEISSEYAGGIGRVLSQRTYEEFAKHHEQSLPLRQKAITLIARLMQDQQIGQFLSGVIARYLERLVITDNLSEGIVAVVNTRTGVVLLNARVVEEEDEWLVLYGLMHEAVHRMHPDETGLEEHVRIHNITLEMLEPARGRNPEDYDDRRFITDLALADIPEVSGPLREHLHNGDNSETRLYFSRRLQELRKEKQGEDLGKVFRYDGISYDPDTGDIEVSWKDETSDSTSVPAVESRWK